MIMKKLAILSLLAVLAIISAGCFSYERRVASRSVVVTETGPGVRETVITTLPVGYSTRLYRGNTYYYSGDVVYRSYPKGGYVVVPRPW